MLKKLTVIHTDLQKYFKVTRPVALCNSEYNSSGELLRSELTYFYLLTNFDDSLIQGLTRAY